MSVRTYTSFDLEFNTKIGHLERFLGGDAGSASSRIGRAKLFAFARMLKFVTNESVWRSSSDSVRCPFPRLGLPLLRQLRLDRWLEVRRRGRRGGGRGSLGRRSVGLVLHRIGRFPKEHAGEDDEPSAMLEVGAADLFVTRCSVAECNISLVGITGSTRKHVQGI